MMAGVADEPEDLSVSVPAKAGQQLPRMTGPASRIANGRDGGLAVRIVTGPFLPMPSFRIESVKEWAHRHQRQMEADKGDAGGHGNRKREALAIGEPVRQQLLGPGQ